MESTMLIQIIYSPIHSTLILFILIAILVIIITLAINTQGI